MTYFLTCLLTSLSSATALASFEAQDRLAPGTFGWWKVWGASPRHIRAGDLVLTMTDDEVEALLILDTFTAKAAPMRLGIITPEGRSTLGALCPIILLRPSTHNTLA